MFTVRVVLFRLAVLCCLSGVCQTRLHAQGTTSRLLTLSKKEYRLQAGGRTMIEASADTIAFLRTAKARSVVMTSRAAPGRGLAIAPGPNEGEVLLAASLTMKSGQYSVVVSATSGSGEQRSASINITLDPPTSVPSDSTVPPVILLNGLQLPSSLAELLTFDTCPPSLPSTTFGSLEALLTAPRSASAGIPNYPAILGAGVPVVYFFDNCVEDRNGPIENLGNVLAEVMNLIRFQDGSLVPQVDVVAHSMGGLIVRSYLAGLQSDGSLYMPVNPRIRKFVEIATPNFGSYFASNYSALVPNGTQTAEMIPGSAFLWNLGTWNQNTDDVRGVDGLAIVGDAGYWRPNLSANFSPNLSDGVVSTTSAAYIGNPSRTRVLHYCHASGLPIDCTGIGIANVNQAPETAAIVLSFLEGTSAWQSIGSSMATQSGGVDFAIENAPGTQFTPLQSVFFDAQSFFQAGALDTVFFDDFASGTATFQAVSTSNQGTTCGPYSAPGGYYSIFRCKYSPVISLVGPLQAGPGLIVQSGGAITVNGIGFGSGQCSTCTVLAYPGPITLAVSSWTDQAITTSLPSSFNGATAIVVHAAAGSDSIRFVAAPATVPPLISLSSHQVQFSYTAESAIPAAQTVNISNSGGGTFTWSASASSSWIALSAAPGTLSVAVNPLTLSPGPYTGTITISAPGASNSPQSITVNLTITAPAVIPTISLSTLQTTFTYTIGRAVPSPASISITNSGGGTLSWSASTNANWLSVTPSGIAPSTLTISLVQAGLGAGNYSANVTVTAPGATNSPQLIGVSLTVAAPSPPTPVISLVANAFSDNTTVIAPNTWIEIKGSNLAPAGDSRIWQSSDFANGQMPTQLDGVSVTIGGKSAYVYYISPTQVNVLTPPDPGLPGIVQVQLTNGTAKSTAVASQELQYSPTLFVFNGGPYVLAHHLDGSLIGPTTLFPGLSSPAEPGEVVVIAANGFGPTSTPVSTGSSVQSGALPTLPTITIGGQPAPVQFAGLVSPGLYQFNVQIPVGLPDGDNTVSVHYANLTTQPGTVITVHQ